MLPEQKILGLPIKFIQEFFAIDTLFINIETFKNHQKNFFDDFSEKLSFRVEKLEGSFFKLSHEEKAALQYILITYPNIPFERYEKYFKALQDRIDYIELQKLFFEFYGEILLSKIREEKFNITQLTLHDLYKISYDCHIKAINENNSDFIDELKKIHGEESILSFIYNEKIKSLITNLKKIRTRRQLDFFKKFLFPIPSSLPYAIRAIMKATTNQSATVDFLATITPWLDLFVEPFFDTTDKWLAKYLPHEAYASFIKIKEDCPRCTEGLSKIYKNFPIFSIGVMTLSLIQDVIPECIFPEKNKNNHYCMHTSVYMFLSYFLAIEETINPIQLESIKYGFISLLMLVSYGIGVETYYNLKEIIDGFNLSKLGLLEKGYLALNTAIGSVSPDNFNYTAVGIDSKDLIFAAFERFIDDHGQKYNLDYKYAAFSIPNIEDKPKNKISTDGKYFPIFKIKKLSNFEFIFTKNTTFCHDPRGIKITPDHKEKFSEEYDISIGTFMDFPKSNEKKCSKGELITAPYIPNADNDAKAIILSNILPESKRRKLVVSSANYLFGLIDPATINNYTWIFQEDYQRSKLYKKEVIGFIVKRILPLEETETPHISRIKITGPGLARPDVYKNIYSINFNIHPFPHRNHSETIFELVEDIPIEHFLGFSESELKYTFYFDEDRVTNKKGLSVINLKKVKNLTLCFKNHYVTTESSIFSIPCNNTFILQDILVNASRPFHLSRPACDYNFYHTQFGVKLVTNMQFTYNNTLEFSTVSFDTGTFTGELLDIYIKKEEIFSLPSNITFDQITAMPSSEHLKLQFNLDNDIAILTLSLKESAKYLDNYSQRIEGYWSKKYNYTKTYLEFSKKKEQAWKTKLIIVEINIEKPYSMIESQAIKINQNNHYDEIVFDRYIFNNYFYFPRENDNDIVITGDFTSYFLSKNNVLYLTTGDEPDENSTIIFLNSKINLVTINNVSYFINFEYKSLLAVNVIGSLTRPLLAPFRIQDSLENYSKITPINSFSNSTRFITLLQFNDELITLRYFNYYQFFTKKDNIQLSKLTQDKLEVEVNQNSKIMEEAVTSSATRPESWLNSLFKYFLNIKNDFKSPVFDVDLPKNPTSKESSIKLDHFPKESTAKVAMLEDTYSKPTLCPIEFNGHPSIYFEGENTRAFYVPEIYVNPLDQFNKQLPLLQVLLHEGKKIYHWFKHLFNERSDQSKYLAEEYANTCLTNQTKNSWKEDLKSIEKQFNEIDRLGRGKVDIRWMKHIFENRKEEYKYLNQLTEQNSEITSTFTENLQALLAELAKIKENLLNYKKETVLTNRSIPYFFNTYKENRRIVDCNVIGLNSRSSESKSNERNTLMGFCYIV